MDKKLVIVFTKNPQLGKCKTRLAASIGDANALKIYQHLIHHTAKVIPQVKADAVAFYSENMEANDAWPSIHFQKQLQANGHLGEKMKAAFAWGFAEGYEHICIVGSDLLDLQASDLKEAFFQLKNHDIVIGPAKDGGYYLLGMNRLHPEAFKNKAWSTSTVLQQTLADLQNQSVFLLSEKNDIDTLEDAAEFPELYPYIPKEILSTIIS